MPHRSRKRKLSGAKKAGRTKSELAHLRTCIATQRLFDSGLSPPEIAVELHKRLSKVKQELQTFARHSREAGTASRERALGSAKVTVLKIAARELANIFSEQNVKVAQNLLEEGAMRITEGVEQVLSRTPLGGTLPRLPAPSPARSGRTRE